MENRTLTQNRGRFRGAGHHLLLLLASFLVTVLIMLEGGRGHSMTALAKRCIVGGSGIGGLMAARVASEFFDEVILLDRDDIPGSPHTRDGVPQGNHFHAILPGGLGIMSQFFPD